MYVLRTPYPVKGYNNPGRYAYQSDWTPGHITFNLIEARVFSKYRDIMRVKLVLGLSMFVVCKHPNPDILNNTIPKY